MVPERKKKKRKKVEAYSAYASLHERKSHSQDQGQNGKGLQNCKAKGMEKGSHYFGPLMQSVYQREEAFIDFFVNIGQEMGKVHTQK